MKNAHDEMLQTPRSQRDDANHFELYMLVLPAFPELFTLIVRLEKLAKLNFFC
jgi:hypothetical protein